MDSILFYGEKDEASRRQVRSAAAQHSHRIGPRKAKAAKRPRADDQPSRRRKLHLAAEAAVDSSGSAALSLACSTAPANNGAEQPVGSIPAPSTASQLASPNAPRISAISLPALEEDESRRQKDKSAGDRTCLLSLQMLAYSSPVKSPSAQLSHRYNPSDFPADQDRNERNWSRSRSHSDTAAHAQSTRLPQYSWTEYPRYTIGRDVSPIMRIATEQTMLESFPVCLEASSDTNELQTTIQR